MVRSSHDAPLDLEIQSLLILHGSTDRAVQALLEKYQNKSQSFQTLEELSYFCLCAGRPAALILFLTKQLELGAKIPWGHFAEAFSMTPPPAGSPIFGAILTGAHEQNLIPHLSRSRWLDATQPRLITEREERKKNLNKKLSGIKQELLDQAEMLKTQELDEQEGETLEKLVKMFPKDPDCSKRLTEYRARKSSRVLEERTRNPREKNLEDLNHAKPSEEELRILTEITKAMQEACQSESSETTRQRLLLDFSVAHAMWDHPEGSLELSKNAADSAEGDWLRIESLLLARRFAQLLTELLLIEKKYCAEPDTALAVVYYRAQCLWGLKKKFEAIELLETLVSVNPSYRAAAPLLAAWKRQAQ